jgi:FAD/FMN-containing dehydrogenase/Fe-S oxidoreductase
MADMSRTELPMVAGAAKVDVGGLRDALAKTDAEVHFDRLSRALYSTDASVYQIVPLGVVLPKTEADIVAIVKECARFRVPLTARGGGTSQAGQAIGAGVVLDCSKYFNAVLEINATERWVRVQPGCVLDDLNLAVKPFGLQFAPDISTSNRATIGGMIANNASGTHSLIHGKTIDHVQDMKVVLADGSVLQARPLNEGELKAKCAQPDQEGECYRKLQRLAAEHAEEIERRYPKIVRRVGGYNLDAFVVRSDPIHRVLAPRPDESGHYERFNLAHLLVGSEGTLAVTLEAKLRLIALPRAKALLVIQFADLLDALAATPAILAHQPSAVEVIDRYILDSTKLNAEASRLRDFLHGDPGAILIVEFYGENEPELDRRLSALETDLRQRGFGDHYYCATDAKRQAAVWKLRKLSLGLSMAEKGDAKALSFVEDSAVPPARLRDYIAEFLAVVARHGTTAGVYAHASVGCLHVRPVINLKTEEGVQRFEAIAADVAELVLKYGGALSGEHGDGLVRSPFQEKMYGPVLYNAFREIKRTFDPLGILNPGKIVEAPPLTANLRYGPSYVTPDVPTTFDFSADGGIVRAAELCAGVGECRKKRDGTMCPSYQATCDERHSTRGRANVLRLAMTGQLEMHGLTDEAVKEALDLCLECKACKSECPTNVDMARLKAEFLHQYYRKHGLPWRNWVFGNVATISKHACRFAPATNWLARSRPGGWLTEKLLGMDRRRTPPRHSRRTFLQALAESKPLQAFNDRFEVFFLFPDTFVNYHEPAVGLATVRLMRSLGLVAETTVFPANPPKLRCCGRPMISNGMLTEAVQLARYNVDRLYSWAKLERPIVACEPSCILTIKDDYPALLRNEDRNKAELVAGLCQSFEEFADRIIEVGGIIPCRPLRSGPKRIVVHAHCHQRALVGVEPLMRLMSRIPGAEVIDLDAGCCGMAGSFGYEKEHYEISRLIGEQRLFPAIRAAGPHDIIVAPGFSCRQQIKHFTGRTALHPAELLYAQLGEHPNP